MRKTLVAILLIPTLSLGACNWQTFSNEVQAVTVGVANPVTKDRLYTFENTMIIAFSGLNAYKRACVAGSVDVNCKANIRAMQVYTRQLPPLLAQTRALVASGDQINAVTVYNQLTTAFDNFKNIAVANNIKVQ